MDYLLILLPFLALMIFNLFPNRTRDAFAFYIALFVFLFQAIVALLAPSGVWNKIIFSGLESIFQFHFSSNALTLVVLLSAAIAGATSLFVARASIKHHKDQFNFINLLMIALIGLNGIAMVSDLFSMYIFIEVLALASFMLIAVVGRIDSYEAVWKYLVLSIIASVFMLIAIALFLITSSGTSFMAVRLTLGSDVLSKLAIALFLSGLFIKAGLVPFHGWLADAYSSAPSAVSVFLAGIVTKGSGIYALFRLTTEVIGFTEPVRHALLTVGLISIVVGALLALVQKDLKRMLAYSSISQMGYIVLALGCGTNLGIFAAMFHFFNHALFKSQLFANAAALEEQVDIKDMDNLGGLAQKMPTTGITSALACLSVAGLPPLLGFWSKLLIIIALWISGLYFFAVVAVLASVLTLAYFLSLQRRIFFGKIAEGLDAAKEAGVNFLIPIIFISMINVGLGVLFPFALKFFIR